MKSYARVLHAAGLGTIGLLMSSTAVAAPVITNVGASFATSPITFTSGDSSFTFSGTGDPFGPLAVQTGGTGQINTIFGQPTTNFPDRGFLTFGPNDQYAAFESATPVRFSNGGNLIGLRATLGSDVFYGFAFTTDSVLNSYGFETVAGRAINPNEALAAPVPEAATWAMMLCGFGLVGAGLRRTRSKPAFA